MDVLSYAGNNGTNYRDAAPASTTKSAQNRTHMIRNRADDGSTQPGSKLVQQFNGNSTSKMPQLDGGDLPNPFGQLGLHFSESELRETAYEILIGACRSSGASRPLTYVSNSMRTTERSLSMSPSLQRSVTSVAASKVKKALGLKSSRRKVSGVESEEADGGGREAGSQKKRSSTVGELMRVQMKVSEQTDSRVRRALLRVAAGQLGRKIETMVLPIELLQTLRSSDFSSQSEYEAWQKRNLKVLEAGLLLHPYFPLDKTDNSVKQLRQILRGASEKPMDTGKQSQSMNALRNVVMSLSGRSFDGSGSGTCHWADGVPLNLYLYQILLESCFDANDDTAVIDEVDEVLELVKKTWVVLGVTQSLHNLCLAWVLFRRYICTGQVGNDLLFATNSLLHEVENDAKETRDPAYRKILTSILTVIFGWAEERLLAYHECFYRGNIDTMENVLSLGISAAKLLAEAGSQEYNERTESDITCGLVDSYIRSSLKNAFSQEKEKIISNRHSSRSQHLPMLSILAQNLTDLAFTEQEIFSPILKQWHPLATGVAAATLHACYRKDLNKFVANISELTPDVIQVLIASEKLEKDLVKMAVADSVDSDDGGKALIQEMTPYEAESVIGTLVKSWIKTRVDRLKEWVDRNIQQEVWNPHANKERFAPSAVEVLRVTDETLDAFFLLPIAMHQVLIPDLTNGLDRCLQNYIVKIKSGCGSKDKFLPILPPLTRCDIGSKFGMFKKKERSSMVQGSKSQAYTTEVDNSYDIPRLCVRINTMHLIRKELEVLEKRITSNLRNAGYVQDVIQTTESGKLFEFSAAACVEGIHQLSEATAYRIVFQDLSHVLWDYLYVGDVLSSRIEPFLQELEQNLEIVSATVHDRVRTRVITQIMRASFDGFLLVLLAGGPSRGFSLLDAAVFEQDFKLLMDLFWSEGDGLPIDLIENYSNTVKAVLPLFHIDTVKLIEQFKRVVLDRYGGSDKSKLPLPPSSGQWGPTEPDTVLRVLCHRSDEIASKFLKKNYHLPKKL
ncbi:OLC1v1037423C1 [Oldenlandia corymbosa var. corymbosa]|uniref:OLC1v1037423C1 n=1 Tax=Oldenlandia corymbosa var. corymbosa TaxID=529605 RepID=A0AAV1CXP5_OLDCO|nr:OLC1v1037423C1 [Oldenlandia corymbosa var. corymbosa]